MEEQLVQIKKFLNHHQSQVRLKAVEIVSGCSTDSQLHPFFTKLNIGKQLLDLIGDSDKDISYHSCVSLVNLSSNPNFSLNLLSSLPFDCIMKELRSKYITNRNKELLIKAMVNITQINDGISSLLQQDSSVQGLHVIRLIHILKTIDTSNTKQIRTYHYLPFLLCNITQNNVGRELIMEPQRNLIKYIIGFMDYDFDYHLNENKNENKEEIEQIKIGECYKIFHRGIWNTIRNCFWLLTDNEPQILLKQIKKQKQKNKNDAKKIIHNYYLRIFLDFGQEQEWTKNDIIFQIINPMIAPLHEYPKKFRNKLLKKKDEDKLIQSLLKYMKFDKERFDDLEIRKIALECLHLMAGVDDDFDLNSVFPKILNHLFIHDLLKQYEIWEYSSELIKISKDIRSTIKHQLDKFNKIDDKMDDKIDDKIDDKMDDNKTNNNDENDDDNNNNDNDVDDEKGIKIEPMVQEFHAVSSKEKKTFNKEESSALFDLIMQHSPNQSDK